MPNHIDDDLGSPELALAAEVARRAALPRSGTVRFHLETNPDSVELCVIYNPESSTWTAYPVGGVFASLNSDKHVVTRPSPEAALADVLTLEVSE